MSAAARADDADGADGHLLALAGVGKVFGDGTHALDSVSFTVGRRELVAIVGPSGCGKTTVLRIVSGLTTATSGTVQVLTDRLGYVFQDPTLLPWRTVRRNVELLAELEGMAPTERAAQVDRAIELVGLRGFERHHPKRLSGGMKMRVSLARSLVLDPDVFLFDEPFGSLDEITRGHLNDELQQLFSAKGFGGVFITHSVSEATFLATRVLVMSPRPGRIVADIDVPFDYPRPHDLRFDPAFTEIAGGVSAAMRDQGGSTTTI